MKERTKIRLFAIAAALTLGMFGCVLGQDVKARSFRDGGNNEYDSMAYFNIAVLTCSDGKLEQTDSIDIFIQVKGSKEASAFVVCEKTDLYFAYNELYEVYIKRRGYSTAYFRVNTKVKAMKYGSFIPIYLEPNSLKYDVGFIIWDSKINDIHYYPTKLAYK